MKRLQFFFPFIVACGLFSLTLALGLRVAVWVASVPRQLPVVGVDTFDVSDGIAFVIAAALFILLATRLRRVAGWVFAFILSIFIIGGMAMLWGAFMPISTQVFSGMIAFATLAIWWLIRRVVVHDIVMCLALAGIGGYVSQSFTPITAVMILLVLSFYDILAVYRTRHMVVMAESMIRSRTIFGFVIPSEPGLLYDPLANVVAGGEHMVLGSGDVLLPLILAGSLVRVSIPAAIVTAIASIIGLVIMYILFARQTVRRPMAALPPIATAAIIGYLITAFLNI